MNHQNDIHKSAVMSRHVGILNLFKRFLKDESGQGTAEYALILLVVLMMANTFKRQFKTLLNSLLDGLKEQADKATSDEG